MNMIRCPACRGSKRVAKLGGMIGDCNCCKGKGEIDECDKPNIVMAPIPEPVAEIVKAVSQAVAVSPEPVTQELPLNPRKSDVMAVKKFSPEPTPQEVQVKFDKPNIYKRKGA